MIIVRFKSFTPFDYWLLESKKMSKIKNSLRIIFRSSFFFKIFILPKSVKLPDIPENIFLQNKNALKTGLKFIDR